MKDLYETYVEWLEAEKIYHDINGYPYPEELERKLEEFGILEDDEDFYLSKKDEILVNCEIEEHSFDCQCEACKNAIF